MTYTLRKATFADRHAIKQLIVESARSLSREHYSGEQIEATIATVFGVDTNLIIDGTYFVAESDGQLIGCGGWSKRKTLFGGDQMKSGGIDALLDPATEAARIRAFYVHPRWARQGIGSKLIAACEAAARAAGFSRIELLATLPGEPLYTANGYEKAGATEIETPNESLPAVRMIKSL